VLICADVYVHDILIKGHSLKVAMVLIEQESIDD